MKNSNSKEATAKLKAFTANFPTDAKCWSQATDEIRDLTYTIRSYYNEMVLDLCEGDEGYIESLNFRIFATPARWNSEARKMITQLWRKMTPAHQERFIHQNGYQFNR